MYLRPKQNGRHFENDIFKLFFYDNEFILIQISRKYVRKGAIYNKPALVRMKMIFL